MNDEENFCLNGTYNDEANPYLGAGADWVSKPDQAFVKISGDLF